MKFSTSRSTLLKPVQAVIGVVERRQTMPILANLLLVAKGNELAVTATDLEVELVASAEIKSAADANNPFPVNGVQIQISMQSPDLGYVLDISDN